MADISELNSVRFKNSLNSRDQQTEQDSKSSPVPEDRNDWESFFSSADFGNLANSIGNDNSKRFELATMLAEQDLANNISGMRRNDRNFRDLTDMYFYDKLGGSKEGQYAFDTDKARGTDSALFNMFDTINGGLNDYLFQPIGDAIDFVGDNTLGNIIGLVNPEAGKDFKNALSGEDLAWIPSAAFDIGTWALPGSWAWKIPTLVAKGLIENSGSFNRAITGRDQHTGEALDEGQRFLNALAGTAGTALTALPGAGVTKGLRAAKGAKTVEAGGKEAALEARRLEQEGLQKQLSAASDPDEIAKIQKELKEKGDEVLAAEDAFAKVKNVPQTAFDVSADTGKKLPQGGLFDVAGTPYTVPQTAKRVFGDAAEYLSEGSRASRKASREAAQKEIQTAKELRDQAAEAYSKLKRTDPGKKKAREEQAAANQLLTEAEAKGNPFQRAWSSVMRPRADGKLLPQMPSPAQMIGGQSMMGLNEAIQNSANLGSESQGLIEDWSALADNDEARRGAVFAHALGLIPGLGNKSARRYGRRMPSYGYLARTDLAGKNLANAYGWEGIEPSDMDLAILAQALRLGNFDSAAKQVADYYKEVNGGE